MSDLRLEALRHAFNQALRNLGDFLPSIAQLRAYAEQWRPETIENTAQILGRGDKPPDWAPLEPGELEAMRERARKLEQEIRNAAGKLGMPEGAQS